MLASVIFLVAALHIFNNSADITRQTAGETALTGQCGQVNILK